MNKRVLVSLHDVTPYHFSRLQKAEEYLIKWGVTKLNYLFIPDYHYRSQQLQPDVYAQYKQWIFSSKGINIQWLLHGYYHLDSKPAAGNSDPIPSPSEGRVKNYFKKRFLTAHEGEFLELPLPEIEKRIKAGQHCYRDIFQTSADTFIAPAWLFNRHLIPVLKEHRFKITEDHSFIYLLENSTGLRVPVITWATRTWLRKTLSRIGCPILNRVFFHKELIRLAVHPFDFDHPETVRSIESVVKNVLTQREPILYKELLI